MDGYEVAAQVRGDPRLKDIPIIMITSRAGEKHRARAIELGVDDYLGKPYQESQLLDAIAPLVAHRLETLGRFAGMSWTPNERAGCGNLLLAGSVGRGALDNSAQLRGGGDQLSDAGGDDRCATVVPGRSELEWPSRSASVIRGMLRREHTRTIEPFTHRDTACGIAQASSRAISL